jgi:hypothetical protein
VSFDYDSVLEYSSTVENGIARDDIADRQMRLSPPTSSAYEEDSSTASQLTLMRSIILSVADELHLMSEDCWDVLSTSGLSPSTTTDIIKLFKAKIGLLRQSDSMQEKAVATTPSSTSSSASSSSSSSSSSVSTRPEEASRRWGGDPPCLPSSIGPGKDSVSDPSPSTDSAVGRWEVVGDDDGSDWNWNSLPPFGLRSPEIAHLLHTWTTDEGKVSNFQLLRSAAMACVVHLPHHE